MNRIFTVSKKTISLVLAMLMAFSVMATAFADGGVRPAAPASLNIIAAFSDTVVVEAIEGGEYAVIPYIDGVADPADAEFKASNIFTGLTPDSKYSVLARFAATETDIAGESIQMDVITGSKENDPVVIVNDTDITVNHDVHNIVCTSKIVEYNGNSYPVSYSISPYAGVDASSLSDGSSKFGNLTAGTTYSIIGKITVAGIEFKSAPVKATLKMSQNSPAAPFPTSVTDTTIEIKVTDASAVYSIIAKGSTEELVWEKKNVFTGLIPEETYIIYAKLPATETYLESAPIYIECTTLIASAGKAPAPALENKNSTSIQVKAADGKETEFSIDGGKTWNKTGVFTGLEPGINYNIIARYVFEEGKQAASIESDSVSIITNKRTNYEAAVSNCTFELTAEKVYAKDEFSFTLTGDAYSDVDQYGDTRYIPYSWSYGDDTEYALSNALICTGTLQAPDSSQDISVKITYKLQKYNGSDWDTVGYTTETYPVHVSPEYSHIKAFFENIFNFVLNFIPKLIVELINRFA